MPKVGLFDLHKPENFAIMGNLHNYLSKTLTITLPKILDDMGNSVILHLEKAAKAVV